MTVIIGIKCNNGVVLASDSGATQGPIMQSNKKLHKIGEACLVGSAGPEGLGQLIRAQIHRNYEGMARYATIAVPDVMMGISAALRLVLLPEREALINAKYPIEVVNQQMSQTLVAVPVQNAAMLLAFDPIANPVEVTEHLPVVSIGTGALLAQPFLGFIRRVLWDGKLPNLADGKMAAYWAMKHTLSLAAGNVAPPIKVAVLAQRDNQWVASELEDEELEEHDLIIAELEEQVRKFPSEFKQVNQSSTMPELERVSSSTPKRKTKK